MPRLLVLLAVASGVLDVVCVTRLGGFFASVITGNLVQVGRALAAADLRALAGGAVAVGGYAAGVGAGSQALHRAGQGWRRRTTAVATAEAALLVVVAAGWLATGARPGYGIGLVLLAGAALGGVLLKVAPAWAPAPAAALVVAVAVVALAPRR
ncbi:DUF1275 family protein [Micromonospora sp. I033]